MRRLHRAAPVSKPPCPDRRRQHRPGASARPAATGCRGTWRFQAVPGSAGTGLELVGYKQRHWWSLPDLLRLADHPQSLVNGAQVQHRRPARQQCRVGDQENGPRDFRQSCRPINYRPLELSGYLRHLFQNNRQGSASGTRAIPAPLRVATAMTSLATSASPNATCLPCSCLGHGQVDRQRGLAHSSFRISLQSRMDPSPPPPWMKAPRDLGSRA